MNKVRSVLLGTDGAPVGPWGFGRYALCMFVWLFVFTWITEWLLHAAFGLKQQAFWDHLLLALFLSIALTAMAWFTRRPV